MHILTKVLLVVAQGLNTAVLASLLAMQVSDTSSLQRQLDHNSGRLDAVEKRVDNMESMHVEAHLARIEQIMDDQQKILITISIAVFLNGVGTLARWLPGRKKVTGNGGAAIPE